MVTLRTAKSAIGLFMSTSLITGPSDEDIDKADRERETDLVDMDDESVTVSFPGLEAEDDEDDIDDEDEEADDDEFDDEEDSDEEEDKEGFEPIE